MSAPRKISDAAILGVIRALERNVRTGPSQRDIAAQLGVNQKTITARLQQLVDAGEVEKSAVHGYVTTTPPESETP